MKLGLVFTVNAIVSLVSGLAAIFAPAQTAAAYGFTLTDVGVAVMRIIGACYIGFAATAWFVRNAPASETRRAVVMAFFVGIAVSTIVFAVNALAAGGAAAAGWFNVMLSLAFALAYAYFAFVKPDAA